MGKGFGLEEHRFDSFDGARSVLADHGWVETSRSGSAGAVAEIRYFNKLVGGEGKLFHTNDGALFLGTDGWFSKWLRREHKAGRLQ